MKMVRIAAALIVQFVVLFSASVAPAQSWKKISGAHVGEIHDAISPSFAVTNAPKAGANGAISDNLDIYIVQDDDSVRVSSCGPVKGGTSCRWSKWVDPGPGQNFQTPLVPSAVAWDGLQVSGNHREIFAINTADLLLWHTTRDGATSSHWSGWTPLVGGGPAGVQFCSQPSSTSYFQGNTPIADVFVQGCDSKLYHINFNGSAWQSWEQITPDPTKPVNQFIPNVATAPSAVIDPTTIPPVTHVVFSDNSDSVWDACTNNEGWSYVPVPGVASFLPTTAPNVAGTMAIIAPETDNSANQQLFAGTVFEFNNISDAASPTVVSSPTSPLLPQGSPVSVAYMNGNAGIDAVFYKTAAGHVAYQVWQDGAWITSEHQIANDLFAFDPVSIYAYAGNNFIGHAYVFAAKADGSMWYTFLTPH
jgi:hypothetical protein